MVFLEVACQVKISFFAAYERTADLLQPQIAETAVYSLNKTSTREFIMRKAATFGFVGKVLAEMRVSSVLF